MHSFLTKLTTTKAQQFESSTDDINATSGIIFDVDDSKTMIFSLQKKLSIIRPRPTLITHSQGSRQRISTNPTKPQDLASHTLVSNDCLGLSSLQYKEPWLKVQDGLSISSGFSPAGNGNVQHGKWCKLKKNLKNFSHHKKAFPINKETECLASRHKWRQGRCK